MTRSRRADARRVPFQCRVSDRVIVSPQLSPDFCRIPKRTIHASRGEQPRLTDARWVGNKSVAIKLWRRSTGASFFRLRRDGFCAACARHNAALCPIACPSRSPVIRLDDYQAPAPVLACRGLQRRHLAWKTYGPDLIENRADFRRARTGASAKTAWNLPEFSEFHPRFNAEGAR